MSSPWFFCRCIRARNTYVARSSQQRSILPAAPARGAVLQSPTMTRSCVALPLFSTTCAALSLASSPCCIGPEAARLRARLSASSRPHHSSRTVPTRTYLVCTPRAGAQVHAANDRFKWSRALCWPKRSVRASGDRQAKLLTLRHRLLTNVSRF